MTTLVVLAHPERRSFNGSWADATVEAARKLGHDVLISDLCAMGFDPVEGPGHYRAPLTAGRFDPLKAQEHASATDRLPDDVRGEIDKLERADRIVFHFPLWWFAPPAILKGWFERVLVNGRMHGVRQRFDSGLFRGKAALFCVTTGSSAEESAFDGKEGDVQMLLWPAAYTLRYLGFDVLQPEIVHGVHGYHKGEAREALQARLRTVLDNHGALMAGWSERPRIAFNADTDFDAHGRLLPDRPSHSLFIRHRAQARARAGTGDP